MATREELRALTSEVKAVVARGKRALKKQQKAGKSHVPGRFAKIAEEEKVSQAQLRQAVKFARTYSAKELREFLQLKTPSGKPPNISVAYQVMYVANRQRRAAIARQAVEGGWSIRKVKDEVTRRVGANEKARKGGRAPRLPTNPDEALRQLDEKCDQWNRWVSHLDAKAGEPGSFSIAQLPESVRKRVKEVTLAMQKLAGEVAKRQSCKQRNP